MELIKTTNLWSCGLASIAMLLNEDPEELILELGHSGGEIFWPGIKEPECFRGFHTQEFVDLCFARSYALIEIVAQPLINNKQDRPKKIWNPEREEARISNYMEGNSGILIGELETGARHACAWDGMRVYDPRGFIYKFEDSTPEVNESESEFYPMSVAEFLMLKALK